MNAETSKMKANCFLMMSPPSAETATKWITLNRVVHEAHRPSAGANAPEIGPTARIWSKNNWESAKTIWEKVRNCHTILV